MNELGRIINAIKDVVDALYKIYNKKPDQLGNLRSVRREDILEQIEVLDSIVKKHEPKEEKIKKKVKKGGKA